MDTLDYWWWELEVLQHLDNVMVFSCFKGEAEINEEESSVVSVGCPGVVADSAQDRPLHYQYPFFPPPVFYWDAVLVSLEKG